NLLRRSLPRRGLAALASCRLLLRGRPSLLGVASRTGLLATAARSPRGVGDPRRSLLGHPLVLESFVLSLVLDARSLVGHRLSFHGFRIASAGLPRRLP